MVVKENEGEKGRIMPYDPFAKTHDATKGFHHLKTSPLVITR